MVDRERILVKMAELDGYLNELRQIQLKSFDDRSYAVEISLSSSSQFSCAMITPTR